MPMTISKQRVISAIVYKPIAMKISFTLLAVFADVSMKSRPLSSAYVWASCKRQCR